MAQWREALCCFLKKTYVWYPAPTWLYTTSVNSSSKVPNSSPLAERIWYAYIHAGKNPFTWNKISPIFTLLWICVPVCVCSLLVLLESLLLHPPRRSWASFSRAHFYALLFLGYNRAYSAGLGQG